MGPLAPDSWRWPEVRWRWLRCVTQPQSQAGRAAARTPQTQGARASPTISPVGRCGTPARASERCHGRCPANGSRRGVTPSRPVPQVGLSLVVPVRGCPCVHKCVVPCPLRAPDTFRSAPSSPDSAAAAPGPGAPPWGASVRTQTWPGLLREAAHPLGASVSPSGTRGSCSPARTCADVLGPCTPGTQRARDSLVVTLPSRPWSVLTMRCHTRVT